VSERLKICLSSSSLLCLAHTRRTDCHKIHHPRGFSACPAWPNSQHQTWRKRSWTAEMTRVRWFLTKDWQNLVAVGFLKDPSWFPHGDLTYKIKRKRELSIQPVAQRKWRKHRTVAMTINVSTFVKSHFCKWFAIVCPKLTVPQSFVSPTKEKTITFGGFYDVEYRI
jgi:hypothetical protein